MLLFYTAFHFPFCVKFAILVLKMVKTFRKDLGRQKPELGVKVQAIFADRRSVQNKPVLRKSPYLQDPLRCLSLLVLDLQTFIKYYECALGRLYLFQRFHENSVAHADTFTSDNG